MSERRKEKVRAVLGDMEQHFDDLPDGAWWGIAAERLGMESWELQEIVASDPEYFGWETP